jgi:hypothetical protein
MGTSKSQLLPWTPENKALLIKLFDVDGQSQAFCAKKMTEVMGRPVSVSAIAGQIRVLRQSGRMQWTRPEDTQRRVRRDNNARLRHKSKKGATNAKKKEPPPPKPSLVREDLSSPISQEDGAAMIYDTMQAGRCLFMYGDPKFEFSFCGRPVSSERGPWCAGHHRVCYQEGTSRKAKRAPDDKKVIANAKFNW